MYKILILFFLLFQVSFSQEIVLSETEKLNREIAELNSQGRIEEAVVIAQKITDIEKSKGLANTKNYLIAFTNFTRLKNKVLQTNLSLARQNLAGSNDNFRGEVAEVEELFENIIKIYKKDLPNDAEGLAEAKMDLAVFLEYKPVDTFDNFSDRFNVKDKIEKLLLDSLELREKDLGKDSFITLSSVLKLADFYGKKYIFQKQWDYCQRYINSFRAKFGTKDKRILPALNMYLNLLLLTDKTSEADKINKEIAELSGKDIQPPQQRIDILSLAKSKIELVLGEDLQRKAMLEAVQRILSGSINNTFKVSAKTSYISVNVLVDETGKIIESKFEAADEKHKKEIESRLKNVKFNVLKIDGSPSKMRGIIYFRYYTKPDTK